MSIIALNHALNEALTHCTSGRRELICGITACSTFEVYSTGGDRCGSSGKAFKRSECSTEIEIYEISKGGA
jgi:hypothetical protein